MFLCYLIVANQYIHLLFPDLFLRANCLYLSNNNFFSAFMSKTLIELLSVQFKFFLQQFFVNNLVVCPMYIQAFPSTISFVIFGRSSGTSQYTSSPEKAAIGCPNRDLITTMRDFPKSLVLQTICNNAIQFRKLFFESDQFPIF